MAVSAAPAEIGAALDAKRRLHPGAAVTSHKNVVDHVVTEYGVAELRGRPIGERTRKLIEIAHPEFREGLEREGRELGFI